MATGLESLWILQQLFCGLCAIFPIQVSSSLFETWNRSTWVHLSTALWRLDRSLVGGICVFTPRTHSSFFGLYLSARDLCWWWVPVAMGRHSSRLFGWKGEWNIGNFLSTTSYWPLPSGMSNQSTRRLSDSRPLVDCTRFESDVCSFATTCLAHFLVHNFRWQSRIARQGNFIRMTLPMDNGPTLDSGTLHRMNLVNFPYCNRIQRPRNN